ncbi:MAG: tryptophan synthase subunit beta like protein [Gammaproteobacteria bacterium]|jgi:hypothetical protein|nr:tryptophan synthase subunit beta like protein [Gammaproteobacteria bacterium]
MVYVNRDDSGAITAVSQVADGHCTEPLSADDPQLRQFLLALEAGAGPLEASDQDFVRVLEDLVDLLIDKGVILFTELPDSAQEKIMKRQRLRSQLSSALDLLDND